MNPTHNPETESPLPIPAQAQTPAAVMNPRAAVDPRDSCVIASIWPFPFRSQEPHYHQYVNNQTGEVRVAASTIYEIEGGSASSTDAASNVRLLRVYDSYFIRQLPGEEGSAQPLPISCRSVAAGLIQKWTGANGALSGNGPGIMMIAGDTPTQEEMQTLLKAQQTYMQSRFTAGERSWQSGALREIGEVERAAARWLNMHTRVQWFSMTNAAGQRECISCGGSLSPTATSCRNEGCGDLLAKADQGYWSQAELKEKDPYLYGALKAYQTRRRDRERKAAERGGSVDDEE